MQALEASIEVLDAQFQACELTKYDVTPLNDADADRPTKDASLGSTCEHISSSQTKHFIIDDATYQLDVLVYVGRLLISLMDTDGNSLLQTLAYL